jgi:hypothetical protein
VKKYFLFLMIGFLSFSCIDKDKRTTAPENLLTKEQMIGILTEMHIAEAKASAARLPHDSATTFFMHLQEQIMDKYNTDTAQYRLSYKWYSENVKEMDEIYATVVDSLGARESTVRLED